MRISNFYNFRWGYLFTIIITLYISFTYLTNSFILTGSLYYSSFGNQIPAYRINEIIQLSIKFQWIGYIITPILLLLKWGLIAGIIFLGAFLFNQFISFKDCFRIVIMAEFVPIVVALIRLLYFFISHPSTLQDIQLFYPLSALQLFNITQIPSYFIYPLQQLNVFEIFYWLIIAIGIKVFIKKSFGYSLKIVASSYGVALGIWVLCVVFIQLQFSS